MGSEYPEYINVSQHGDEVEVIVRAKRQEDGREGATTSVRFPKVVFELMLEDARKNLTQ
jgi:hypothetical protein